ncbi:MAG: di-trans,poly-cis-decaprenylcistransferase [Oscillibacter sp.]|nr:di-trans,poly-cis-decaprenylcistransferase [Oscillibacter sp.]
MAGRNDAGAGAVPPRHIAIIMDGNGRWATKRNLPRTAGHKVGAETFRKIAYYCKDIGIRYLTVYAFSTENWKRSVEEVNVIMRLLERYLYELMELMARDHFRIRFFGDLTGLPPSLEKLARRTYEVSGALPQDYCLVNLCINYGGRDEILRAARRYAADCAKGTQTPENLDDALFSSYLDSAGIPDPELIIRPSGELRLSNFLLWQCAYSEFYFTDTLWPDFTTDEIDRAIAAYAQRNRRFGGVKESK